MVSEGKRFHLRFILPLLLLTATAGGVLLYKNNGRGSEQTGYRLGLVEQGPVISTVLSSGTLKAVVTVQVGSQVSGRIMELIADFNSEVKAGQVIARLDPENFEAKVMQAEAELAVAESNVSIQQASLEKARAELVKVKSDLAQSRAKTEQAKALTRNAKVDLDRKKALLTGKAVSRSEIDAAETLYLQYASQLRAAQAEETSQSALIVSQEAQVRMAKAQVENARAQVRQKEASLRLNQVELDHTIIRSPVDGVVIERSVDVGQTVAASLQAPTLFTIAQDLSKMQVEASVDEADIGQIQPGQRAWFTVDSYPGREFEGRVMQIRKAAVTLQNVVTYTVIISAGNSNKMLLPGMTANVSMVTAERSDVIKIPNAAFRFRPTGGTTDAAKKTAAPSRTGSGGERLEMLKQKLDLGPEQEARLRSIFEEMRSSLKAMRESGGSAEQIATERKRLRRQAEPLIAAVLTPAQKEKYQQMLSAGDSQPTVAGRVYVPGPDGEPHPVDLVLGISDGGFTELIRGDLSPGRKVIIGAASTPKKENSSSRVRLGF